MKLLPKVNIHKGIERLVNRAKKSTTFIFISIVLILFSSLITLSQGGNIIKGLYLETDFGYKNELLDKLNNLSAGVNIGIFTESFGSPTFKTKVENKDIYEYIFLDDKYYYLQALTDLEGTVLAYSVTTRNKEFNPVVSIWSGSKEVKLELGKTKFFELGEPEKITSYLGVHNFYYSEYYYFGNPGLYQSYYFTLNEAGYMGDIFLDSPEYYNKIDFNLEFDDSNVKKDVIRTTDKDVITFRENSIINTYTITAPLVDFDGEVFKDVLCGPDINQVRVLD